jgi:hypothetical protein
VAWIFFVDSDLVIYQTSSRDFVVLRRLCIIRRVVPATIFQVSCRRDGSLGCGCVACWLVCRPILLDDSVAVGPECDGMRYIPVFFVPVVGAVVSLHWLRVFQWITYRRLLC